MMSIHFLLIDGMVSYGMQCAMISGWRRNVFLYVMRRHAASPIHPTVAAEAAGRRRQVDCVIVMSFFHLYLPRHSARHFAWREEIGNRNRLLDLAGRKNRQ
jgi:hypothetical protein